MRTPGQVRSLTGLGVLLGVVVVLLWWLETYVSMTMWIAFGIMWLAFAVLPRYVPLAARLIQGRSPSADPGLFVLLGVVSLTTGVLRLTLHDSVLAYAIALVLGPALLFPFILRQDRQRQRKYERRRAAREKADYYS